MNKTTTFRVGEEGASPLPSHQATFFDYMKYTSENTKPYLVLVETERDRTTFNRIISVYHSYVPTTKYGGRRINWLVRSRNTRQVLGVIGVGSAIMAMKSRDNFIGWTKKQRIEHLINIANNWRFCLLPNTPKNFGSQVLSLLCKLAPREWEKKYEDKLVLLETLVEPPHKGIVYIAQGWHLVGLTKGTGYKWISKTDYPKYEKKGWSVIQKYCKYGDKIDTNKWQVVSEKSKRRKLIFVKPLVKNFKNILKDRLERM